MEQEAEAELVADKPTPVHSTKEVECTKTDKQSEYVYKFTTHPDCMLSGMNELRKEKLFCDVTICVDGQQFLCHKLVLAAFSPYFRGMFSSCLAESQQENVTLKGVEADMVFALIQCAYSSQIVITEDNVQSLLSAANLLEVLRVVEACCEVMQMHMDDSNCIGVHCFAEAHACADLQQTAKSFILSYFSNVCQQEELLSLTQQKLVEFIADDALCVESEEIVFNAVCRWLEYDLEERSSDFSSVLEHVRLPLINPYFLHDVVDSHHIITKSTECQSLINEAKTYNLLKDRHLELRNARTRPRLSSGTMEVMIAVGGEDDKVVLRSVESFDPVSKHWKTLACLPFAVSKHGLVVTGSNHLYMAGGEFPDGSASRSMWRYDPCFDNWQEMASLNLPRSELGLAMLDGYIYAVGGWEGNSRLDSVERYDPVTNSWHMVAPMKMAVTSPAVVAHSGLLYVTGGAVLEDGDGIDLVQCFNPRSNFWNELPRMRIARSGSAACVLSGKIYVIGGWHASTENTNKVEHLNPCTKQWTLRAPMNERRYRPGVAVVDGKIYVCGGEEGWDRYHDTIECYDDVADQWTIIGEMPTRRSWLSCVSMTIHRDNAPKDRREKAFNVNS